MGLVKWKGKYPIDWCHLCDIAIISCEKCGGTTCNAHSCSECHDDFELFQIGKHRVQQYMNDAEVQAYEKGLRLQHYIVLCHSMGFSEIIWDELIGQKKMSVRDIKMFAHELKLAGVVTEYLDT